MKDRYYLGLKAWDMGYDAHLTVHYLGELSQEDKTRIAIWIDKHQLTNYHFHVARDSIAMFGPKNNIPVLKLRMINDELTKLQQECEQIWGKVSDYPWNPHITLKFIPGQTIHIPELIRLSGFNLYT
jgi:2'-5' RNA ligase